MSRTHAILTIAVATVMAFPAAAATWYAYGTYEPDSVLDDPTLNTYDLPTPGVNRVYFNGYTTYGEYGQDTGGLINPNVGVLKTNIDAPGTHWFEALLGIWQDCNKDGYVGMAETAVREYSWHLIDESVCKKTLGLANQQFGYQWNGYFAYNGWVMEFIPVAAETGKISDAHVIVDETAAIWMDRGLPDDNAAPPTIPCIGRARYGHNDGDARTTGGLVYWFDCQGQGRVSAGGQPIFLAGTWDAAAPAGYEWGPDPRQSSSPLNMKTFGDDDADRTIVYAQDCSTDDHDGSFDQGEGIIGTSGNELPGDYDRKWQVRRVGNGDGPSGGTGDFVRGEVVNDGADNTLGADDVTYWSIPGTVNYTAESTNSPVHGRLGPQPQQYKGFNTDNCDWSDDAGEDFYYTTTLERAIDIPALKGKDTTTNFVHYPAQRGGFAPANVVPTPHCARGYPVAAAPICIGGNAGYPTDMGIEVLNWPDGSSAHLQSNWFAGTTTYTPALVRESLIPSDPTNPNTDPAFANPVYWTFYARVSSQTKAFTPGQAYTDIEYGLKQCGDNAAVSNWNCDQKEWYKRTDGTYPEPPSFGRYNEDCTYKDGSARYPNGPACRAIVGDTYNLRDIDCWDGGIHNTVGVSAAFYGDNRCDRPVDPIHCVLEAEHVREATEANEDVGNEWATFWDTNSGCPVN